MAALVDESRRCDEGQGHRGCGKCAAVRGMVCERVPKNVMTSGMQPTALAGGWRIRREPELEIEQ
jgi:hypothetical protein